ncbi:MAG: carboxypeptidase regulatory-like domain-containing protein [Candidatus Hydrogenedentes bacterium]|nr:carboxypeptidase regulatory-like domain-containing protein [Candidatus Hydrogenedentota bacterium]
MVSKRRSVSSVSVVRVVAMIVLVLLALIGLAFMLAPHKPIAPPASRIVYEPRPEERVPQHTAEAPAPELAAPAAVQEVSMEGEAVIPEVVLPEEPEDSYTISGSVVTAADRKPVRNAHITVTRNFTAEDTLALAALAENIRRATRTQLTRPHRVQSDRKGEFTLMVPHEGIYKIEVLAAGYVTFTSETPLLNENAPETQIEVLLSSGASITGKVLEVGTDEGAGGLIVRAEAPGRPFGVTGEDGTYLINGLAPGEFGVAVDLGGSTYMAGRDLPYRRVTVSSPDEKITGIDFTVDPAGLVWGYVMSPDQEPVAQTGVMLTSGESMLSQALKMAGKRRAPATDNSGEDGYYELPGVPLNEEFRVHAMSTTYAPQLSDPFILTESNRTARVDIYMFAGTNVYGRVVDAANQAVPGADIMCIPSYGRFFGAMTAPQAFRGGTTDSSGTFTLEELPGGEYQIFAQKKGYRISPIGQPIYPDGYSDLNNIILTLRGVDEGAHAVFGTVLDDQGQGIDGAQVRLAGVSMGGLEGSDRSVTTSGGGTFQFDGVSAGQYTIIVTHDGFSPTTVRRVRLNEATTITLRQSARVRGTVLLKETNQPPETYDVAGYPVSERTGAISMMGMASDSASEETFFAPDGSFELILNAGTYRIEASAEGYTPSRQEITIQAGDIVDGIEFVLDEKGGIISGTVVAGDDGSVQGAEVALLEASTPAEALMMLAANSVSEDRMQRVGEDGVFTFDSLPAGAYVIIAQHPNYPNAQSEMLYLEEGGEQENVRVRFGSGGALEGYVYQDGQAVPDAMILVVGNGITEHTTADSSGYYYLDELASGTYQAMVTDIASGDLTSVYDARGVQVVVEEGQATRYDFGTGSGGRIEGRCMPGPSNMLGGRAVLGQPGYMQAALGETVEVTELLGQSVGITPMGTFVMEDVPQGEWQLDIYYFELGVVNPLDVRYVHVELVEVTEGELLTLNLPIAY